MQLVHRCNTNTSQLAIISILYDSSNDKESSFWSEINPRTTTVGKKRSFSLLSKVFDPLYGNFFVYNGSLTSPNCTEIVRWFVFAEVQDFSLYYAGELYNIIGSATYIGNYRSLQNRNGRTVQLVSKVPWA